MQENMGLEGEEEQNVKVRQDVCYIITKFPLTSIFFFNKLFSEIVEDSHAVVRNNSIISLSDNTGL